MSEELQLFEGKRIRHIYDEENNKWYFSIEDIVKILTDSINPKDYIKKLRKRDEELSEGWGQIVTPLKMQTAGGLQKVNCADMAGIFRIIQSIPSKKAEPIKQWLAKVGQERVQEMADPTTAIDRARETYKKLGRSDKWIQQRMTGQETRNKLTDYWKDHEITEGKQYAILTNIIHQEWSGLSVKEHKNLKGLKSQNLRDHMSEAELIFTALAELSTRQIAESENATGMEENKASAKKGGKIAKEAREKLELQTGKNVVTGDNFLPLKKNKAIEDKNK
ncbi:MAG: Bro-N domain-containing protein [Candidatus Gastranaerophilales bacterium]|nr:Bro-N domain-containing protein [Candidatus Gastranaerophilales bacterium]